MALLGSEGVPLPTLAGAAAYRTLILMLPPAADTLAAVMVTARRPTDGTIGARTYRFACHQGS